MILIKDIDLPTNCASCPLKYRGYHNRLCCAALPNKDEIPKRGILVNCPIQPFTSLQSEDIERLKQNPRDAEFNNLKTVVCDSFICHGICQKCESYDKEIERCVRMCR